MRERWKAIIDPPNLKNAYVSNTGKIKYLNTRGQWKTTFGSKQNGGYCQVKLGRKKWCVHILVAKQWLEKKCSAFTVCHHINGVRTCNFANNIQWTSQQLNASLRMNSSMCICKKGRYFSKFIFDGREIKSIKDFDTPQLARKNALIMSQTMYNHAYNQLIQKEHDRIDEDEEKFATDHCQNNT